MRQVVYLDEIILVNLVMNLTVLWLTSRFTGNKVSPTRILTSAAVGCIYALSVFLPEWGTVGLGIKLLVSGLMVMIAFGFVHWKKFLRNLLCLLLAGFCVGGVAFGLHYLSASTLILISDNQWDIIKLNKWPVLACTVLLSYIIGRWGATIWHKRVGQISDKIPITVTLWGKEVFVQALVDTGNQLVDPISQHPVIVVEYEVLKPVLPASICEIFEDETNKDSHMIFLSLADTSFVNRLKLIPFQSLGREDGMLLGIRPDAVEIKYRDNSQKVKDVVIGIYRKQLSPESAYKALLHPQLLAS